LATEGNSARFSRIAAVLLLANGVSSLQFFSANQPNLVENIVGWLREMMIKD
jgi:hypothetical protein